MLFSIYIASLIVLSNVMALQSPGSDSPSGVLCNLIVYVGASAKGWVSKKGIQLTTDPDFSKAQTFKLVGSPNTQLPTLRTDDNQVVASDSKTMQSLTIQQPNQPDHFTPAWVTPDYQHGDRMRPTELLLNNPDSNQFTKLQFCTNNQDLSVILQAAAGNKEYRCVDATVIVRKFYGTSVNTFPQNARIGVYQEDDLSFHGWLLLHDSNFIVTTANYNDADTYSLTDGPAVIHIYLGEKYFGWTGDDSMGVFGTTSDRQIFVFTWVDGNPYNLGAHNPDWGLYMCPGAQNPNIGTDYLKIGNKGSDYLSGCVKVLFFISAIK